MEQVLSHLCKGGVVPSDVAILEATLEQLALTGVRRTSADDIARRAGVNRATLYRRFGGRDQLLGSAYLHEAARAIAALEARVPAIPAPGEDGGFDPAENVVAVFREALRLARDNRLLRRMLEVDRDETLAALTVGAGPVLDFAAAVMVDRITALHRWRGTEPLADVRALGYTLARLMQSFVLTPGSGPGLRTRAQQEQYARAVIVPMVLGS
jgi:AcrR family transcriptional regulator